MAMNRFALIFFSNQGYSRDLRTWNIAGMNRSAPAIKKFVSLSLFVFLEKFHLWGKAFVLLHYNKQGPKHQPLRAQSSWKGGKIIMFACWFHRTQNLRTSLEEVKWQRKKCLIRFVLNSTRYHITKWRSNNVCASGRSLISNKKKLKITTTKLVELENPSREIWQSVKEWVRRSNLDLLLICLRPVTVVHWWRGREEEKGKASLLQEGKNGSRETGFTEKYEGKTRRVFCAVPWCA